MADRDRVPYRPISIRLWNDRRFRALSGDGRMLWLHLLSCPATGIPGVIIAGDATIAELLDWTPERVRVSFDEIVRAGINVRREGRVVWLINSLKHQPPAGPNAIVYWSKYWDDIPLGALKHDMWQALRNACKSWSKKFADLFPEPLGEPFPKGVGEGVREGFDTRTSTSTDPDQEPEREPPDLHLRLVPDDRLPARSSGGPGLSPGSLIPDDWKPSDSPANRRAAARAREGVCIPYVLEKFGEQMRTHGVRVHDWDAKWRSYLITEQPTAADVVKRFLAADRGELAKAARDRERALQRQQEQRTADSLEELRRAAQTAIQTDFGQKPEKAIR